MFKEFVEAIYENDMTEIEGRVEPSMLDKMAGKVDKAHREIKDQGCEMRVQSMRGHKHHDTQFFLYNVENIMLSGDVDMDRRKNKAFTQYVSEEASVNVNEKMILMNQIGHIESTAFGGA